MRNSKFLETAIKAAKEAGKISLKHFDKKLKVYYKEKNEIVTNADKECERKIISIIKSKFPNHSFWAEESGNVNKKSDYRWIIDPIDGTTFYSRGIGFYGIAIALELKKEIIMGVNYFPGLNKLYYAEKGKGSYLNDKKIHVSEKSNLKTLFLTSGALLRDPQKMKAFRKDYIAKKLDVKSLGSTALELSLVAEGKADACFEYDIKPGDIAAGIILVREAGGKVIDTNLKKACSESKQIIAYGNKVSRNQLIIK